jgi:hypothetical protein
MRQVRGLTQVLPILQAITGMMMKVLAAVREKDLLDAAFEKSNPGKKCCYGGPIRDCRKVTQAIFGSSFTARF